MKEVITLSYRTKGECFINLEKDISALSNKMKANIRSFMLELESITKSIEQVDNLNHRVTLAEGLKPIYFKRINDSYPIEVHVIMRICATAIIRESIRRSFYLKGRIAGFNPKREIKWG